MVLLSLGGALITGGTLMTKLFNTKFFSFFFFSSYQEPKARRAFFSSSLSGWEFLSEFPVLIRSTNGTIDLRTILVRTNL